MGAFDLHLEGRAMRREQGAVVYPMAYSEAWQRCRPENIGIWSVKTIFQLENRNVCRAAGAKIFWYCIENLGFSIKIHYLWCPVRDGWGEGGVPTDKKKLRLNPSFQKTLTPYVWKPPKTLLDTIWKFIAIVMTKREISVDEFNNIMQPFLSHDFV